MQASLPNYCRYFTNVCYGNGVYVIAGSDEDLNSTYLFYSSNGRSWVISSTMSSTNGCPRNICYGNGKFVLIGNDGFAVWIAYSTNGNTWTFKDLWKSNSTKEFGKYIIYNEKDELFITSGAYYSTDGITWNYNGTGGNGNGNICYGNGVYVIGGNLTTGSDYSYNGKDWIVNSNSIIKISNVDHFPYYIDFYDGYFYSVNGYRTQSKYGKTIDIPIMYSIDGINWNYITKQSPIISSNYGSQIRDGKHVNGTYYLVFITADNIQKINLNTAYYRLSGWNKSDFNITADTSVGGSWSQVSAGGGTNLSELNVGDTFFLGKYQVESETPWDIEWEIVHQTNDYQIAMTKQIIDLRLFDGKESSNTDSSRKNYGNNNWHYSNIEQWMNSDQSNWYSAQHQYDAPPISANCWQYTKDNQTVTNAYDTHKGFLYYWSADEKALLKDMTLTLANNTVTDGGGSYTWTGKVWLPTYTQIGGGQNNSISEGEAFSKFTSNSARIKSLHPNCAANNEYCKVNNYASGKNHWYWMSSARPSNSHSVRYVNGDGSLGFNSNAYYGNYGFAPCICLPRKS